MRDWIVGPQDRELFERELESFVPPRIFDAHSHWYRADHFADDSAPPLVKGGPAVAGHMAFDAAFAELLPGRTIEGLFFPFPHTALDRQAANEFLAEQLAERPGSRGQMLIAPDDDPEGIREAHERDGFVGLKCYHVYSSQRPTFDASIESFLPEAQVRIADELGLSITLHIVRARALADTANQETLRRYCTRYPNMRLILAHAARGFNPHHTIEGISSLKGLGNVWFDTSAVTDCGAIEAIARTCGHERILYGSDFPASHMRGRCIALGDSFLWISADNTDLSVPYGDLQLSLVGLESLRALRVATVSLGLSDSQVEDIFLNNAARLYGL
jgi:glutamate-1-semialdehyde 2,1-aminomutase